MLWAQYRNCICLSLQVKDAYYSLSKMYHPDQYKGQEDASVIFREITEAYEVLGNFQKRRMYDKGLLNTSTAASATEADEYSKKFYEARKRRSQAPTTTGRTPIFDFDEWSKLHYESSRGRREAAKERYARKQENIAHDRENKKTESVVLLFVLFAFLFFVKGYKESKMDDPKSK